MRFKNEICPSPCVCAFIDYGDDIKKKLHCPLFTPYFIIIFKY